MTDLIKKSDRYHIVTAYLNDHEHKQLKDIRKAMRRATDSGTVKGIIHLVHSLQNSITHTP